MKIYDVTLPLCAQTPVWEGDKKVRMGNTSLISEGGDYNVSMFEMGAHTGTHMDAPAHVASNGKTADRIPLERLIGNVQVVQVPDDETNITAEFLEKHPLKKGIRRVLFKTSYSRHWAEEPCPYYDDYVSLDTRAARFLIDKGIQLVGIDGYSIATNAEMLATHRILLEADIVIIEALDLRDVPPGIYDLYCLPLKLIGTDGVPVRAILTNMS
jgi:arylformamidase